ncbi:MAG TPA: type 1 glutamine amidotransferase [Flavisolibacter sp.]|jgi:GMP synthase-like glutamine amidotransferase|nr:type 1 glutamine amidotransferase [Flavisolibacter sp.]
MQLHIIQHVEYESLGYIQNWLEENKIPVSFTRIWEQTTFPDLVNFDGLIIMGGPMNVDEYDIYPWLKTEKQFIQQAITAGKNVAGICLGAQLIANALGSTVFKNHYKEVGWFPVQFNHGFDQWLGKKTEKEMTVFHWHGDSFNLPAGAANLASSDACVNQLFINNNVLGIQFHLEVNPDTLKFMLDNDPEELKADEYVQTRTTILNQSEPVNFTKAHTLLNDILNRFFSINP